MRARGSVPSATLDSAGGRFHAAIGAVPCRGCRYVRTREALLAALR